MTDSVKITRLKLEGFKSIRSMDLPLNPGMNVLVGANGSGKSNFLSFFKFMNKLAQGDLRNEVLRRGGANKILYFGRKKTKKIEISIFIENFNYEALLTPNDKDDFFIEREKINYDGASVGRSLNENSFDLRDKIEARESLFGGRFIEEKNPGSLLGYMDEWRLYSFNDTSDTANLKGTANLSDNDFLRPDGANLPAFLRFIKLKHPKKYQDILYAVRRIAPFFQDFIVEPDAINPDVIRLRWKHRGTDDYFDVSDLSDGTLRFICLATLLLQPNLPHLIIIDEPELGLHPEAIELLGGLMKRAAALTQLIVATQSERLVNSFDWQDLIVIDRVDDASVFRRLTEGEVKEWLEEYRVGDLWYKNVIGGNPDG